jgi:hypothetical protein
MPNWVTNKVSAPKDVLQSLINGEGRIDFNMLIPFTGTFPWDGIDSAAEQCAEVITQQPFDSHPLIASLQQSNRQGTSALKLNDEQFEQFVQMLRNKRQIGYFHSLDFARDEWGTKWNACNQADCTDSEMLEFETAWSCPEPVYKALSAKHPDVEITVVFADEDIGSNCGAMVLKGGQVTSSDVAPNWNGMDETERRLWEDFAYEVTGRQRSEDEDE